MKNKKIIILLFVLLFVLTSGFSIVQIFNYSYALDDVSETTVWYSDYTYTLNEDDRTITLTKYNGDDAIIVIPSKATIENNTYQTVIKGGVFANNTNITNVTFENGVKADTSLAGLFQYCSNLVSVVFNDFDTSRTTNMNRMFENCTKLKTLDLSMFNTFNVTSMTAIFQRCGVTYLNISSFDTTNLTIWASGIEFPSLTKIKIGPKTDFKTQESKTTGSFGRGMWLREEDGKEYAAIDIAVNSSTQNMAGTYVKKSNSIPEMNVDFIADYRIDKFNLSSFTTTNNNIKIVNNRLYIDNLSRADTNDYVVPGNAILLFSDAVLDASGNKYDIKLTIDNIHLYDIDVDADVTNFVHEILSYSNNFLGIKSYNYKDSNFSDIIYIQSASTYDFALEVIDKNGNAMTGNYIFSAYDLDATSTRDSGYGLYSEGINLVEGYDINSLKLANNTYLRVADNNRIYGTHIDNDSELTEFSIKANANKIKFTWTGQTCATALFAYSQPNSIKIEKQDKNGNSLVGAKLELYYGEYGTNDARKIGDEWTTTNSPKEFFLMPGYYSIRETYAPTGYEVANITTFSLDNGIMQNGKKVDKVIVTDNAKKYPVTIYHVEKDNPDKILKKFESREDYNDIIDVQQENITGYKYDSKSKDQITIDLDATKNIAYVYYTKEKISVTTYYIDRVTGKKISSDVVINGEFGDSYNTELKNFDGYKLVQIEGPQAGNLEPNQKNVTYYYERINGYSPQTGDDRNVIAWVFISIISIIGLYLSINYVRKYNKVL